MNLLTNGDFADGLSGWQFVNGHWDLSSKPRVTPSPEGTACQCDRDMNKRTGQWEGWPAGAEDRLWQDVAATEAHSAALLSLTEIQHHDDGKAEIRLYGLEGGEPVLLWQRQSLLPDVPRATSQSDWHINLYTVPLAQVYSAYRVEFYGYCGEGTVGWKFTNLGFEVS